MSLVESMGWARVPSTAPSHPVNIRITIPFLPKSFFFTLIIGPEKRGLQRLREERARHPLNTWGNLLVFLAGWTVFNVAALFVALVIAGL